MKMSSNYINDRVMKNMKRESLVEFYNAYMESSNEIIENLAFEKKQDDVKVLDVTRVLDSDTLPSFRVAIHHGESLITLTFQGDTERSRLEEFIKEVDETGYAEYTPDSGNALICTGKRIRIFMTTHSDGFGTSVSFVLSGYARTRLMNELRKITLMDQ